MNDQEAGLIIAVVLALGDELISLGAESSNRKGHVKQIYSPVVKCLNAQAIRSWLESGSDAGFFRQNLVALTNSEIEKLTRPYVFSSVLPSIECNIELKFDGPFLINNPEAEEQCQKPLLDHDGHPYLPARSFRGALRSQAERIVRTMGGQCCDNNNTCKDDKHCLVCEIFGCTGWQSMIEQGFLTLLLGFRIIDQKRPVKL